MSVTENAPSQGLHRNTQKEKGCVTATNEQQGLQHSHHGKSLIFSDVCYFNRGGNEEFNKFMMDG